MLSSIGGDGTPPTIPPPKSAKPQGLPNEPRAGREADRGPPSAGIVSSNLKRKAEGELSKMNCKVLKDSKASGPSSGLAVPDKSHLPANPKSPTVATCSKQSVPYRATSAVGCTSATPTVPTAQIPKAAPKKGSYAEIMARAKAAQTISPAVGVIKHKPKEKLSEKKELLLAKKGLSGKGKIGSKPGQREGTPNSKSSSPAPGLPSSKKPGDKKVIQPAYKGTAKPVPAYRGTMKAVSSIASNRKPPSSGHPSAAKPRQTRNAASEDDIIDDEELDEGDEDEYPDSESDMEAGFSDVEQEEQMAIKAARKEDEEQALIEDQHKKEKEGRKRMLQQMAKNAKKRSF